MVAIERDKCYLIYNAFSFNTNVCMAYRPYEVVALYHYLTNVLNAECFEAIQAINNCYYDNKYLSEYYLIINSTTDIKNGKIRTTTNRRNQDWFTESSEYYKEVMGL